MSTPAEAPTRPYLLERIDDAAVVQLYADGFAALPLDQKVLMWHLYQAALAGRDIYYDQRYRHNLEMRDLLEALVTHEHALVPSTRAEVWRYTKLFWLNSGGYNNLTARKFVLRLSEAELVEAVEAATRAGAPVRPAPRETPAGLARRLAPFLLDASVDPMVTQKTPGPGGDILRDSANNLYAGVTEADLEGFEERYPLNSRLVKQDGRLVEEVYRTSGRYGAELSRIVRHLEAAIPLATPAFAAALAALVHWYRSGEDADRIAFDIAWVKATDSPVDTMNGFIEVYMDARGIKGAWEGLVYYINVEKTSRIRRLAEQAQWFEDRMPIAPAYRKPVVLGVTATAIDVVVEAGDSGPITPIGVNLPNDQRVREVHGSKSVTLSNVSEAYERSTTDEYRHEFTWDDAEFARAKLWGATASELATEIHEVLGHGSGRMAEGVTAQPQELLKEQYSALEETRADLVALYFCADPRLAELDIVPAEHHAESSAPSTRRSPAPRWSSCAGSAKAPSSKKTTCATARRSCTGCWPTPTPSRCGSATAGLSTCSRAWSASAQGVGEMLREVQRIKSEGDYAAARALFETYGVHFDPELRNEIVAPGRSPEPAVVLGFVMPTLTPVTGPGGEVIDVRIWYSLDFAEQMLGTLQSDGGAGGQGRTSG